MVIATIAIGPYGSLLASDGRVDARTVVYRKKILDGGVQLPAKN